MIVIKNGPEFNKIYATVAYDHWGNPTYNDIRVVEQWDDIDIPADAKKYDANEFFDCNFDDYCDMIENTLWIFNNEPIKIGISDVYMTGAGVNWMFQEGTVNVYDISKIQIKFIKELIANWDGNDYGKFVFKFIVKNKIQHFHLNLDEKQNSQKDLIKDYEKFINSINDNFDFLVKKYSPNWTWNPKNVTAQNESLIPQIAKKYIGKFLLSNIFDFKYYFIKCYIDNAYDYISPSTKAFINHIDVKQNYHWEHEPCKELKLNVPVQEIQQEIEAIKKYLVHNRPESGLGWKAFCIHGQSYDRVKEHKYYKNFLGYKWTLEAIKNMPVTIKWLKSLGFKKFQRVRIMCLEPKGFINIHRDQSHSELGPINVAITHPPQCKFYLENHGELKFAPGKAYQLNLVNYHAVVNNSNLRRYHIIIHGDTVTLNKK